MDPSSTLTSGQFVAWLFSMSHSHSIAFLNATVVDGSGVARFRADVHVQAGCIKSLSWDEATVPSKSGSVRIVDCEDGKLVLAPGFIDMHAHSDLSLLHTPEHAAKVNKIA